ncbi:imelysin family protein [Salipiger sp. PrR002]|uniref:imelysin family protein n=1 Tax=Salipiger sp. PrR002 TaxID=2706489 RepID=UPI0013B8359B|nr:imelysin family protein [Salipiger sp. PrR002]NDV99493.1 imelysin family protein [Salipiger sp. PrR002]NDW57139.1 imelysin family protein [Salipiger sp. PrR004]
MKHRLTLCAVLAAGPLCGPLHAGVPEALSEQILPSFKAFAEATATLAEAAEQDCTAASLRDPWNHAFDRWNALADIHIGPSETGALPVAFWPDSRGFTPKTLSRFIASEDPVGTDPAAFADASIAVRGLYPLEFMLYDEEFSGYAQGSYACTLVQTMTRDLARQAAALETGWTESFANVLLTAGEEGNATYLAEDEAMRALFTQVVSGLEFTADTRLGRPLGSFERPRPTRAEAWRSGRSLRNVLRDAEGAYALAKALADWEMPVTDAAMEQLREVASRVEDPSFQQVGDPSERLHVEIVQQQVRALKDAIEAELGAPLGIAAGFNSADGD